MTRGMIVLGCAAATLLACGGSDASIEECIDISGSDENAVVVFVDGERSAFAPELALVHWDCEDQRLELYMLEQTCAEGVAQDRALIQVYREDVDSGLIESGGTYSFGGDSYLRALFITAENLAWGSCDGEAGEITFESIGTAAGSRVAGSFELPTSHCFGPAGIEPPPGRMQGSFDLRIPESYETACPMGGDPHPRDRR